MLKSFLLTISYDGTEFYGWYCPKNRNLKNTIQKALSLPLLKLDVASRTDRGVHAEDQKIYFSVDSHYCDSIPDLKTINERLPNDMRALILEICPSGFHPSLEAKSKDYHYHFHLGPSSPLLERYSLSIQNINLEKIEQALPFFLGRKNFKAFEGSLHRREDPYCTIEEILFQQTTSGRYTLKIRGNRFLYLMCRKIAGTLLYHGYGKLSTTSLERGFEEISIREIGPTLPPKGLLLKKIHYDRNFTCAV